MIHHPKQSSPVILTATAVCGDSDPGDNDITVRVVCDCNDHVSCTPVTKGDYQYTIGGPIEDTEVEIPDGNDTVVAVGQTIEVSATQGQDMDCKIIGEVVPREEVYDRVGPRWSVRRWNIHTRHRGYLVDSRRTGLSTIVVGNRRRVKIHNCGNPKFEYRNSKQTLMY